MAQEFKNLVSQYHRLVMALIHRYYGGRLVGEAEDLAQDIWIKMWEALKKNENNVVNFKSYLYRTVQTTLWDAIRRLDRDEQHLSLEETPEFGELSESHDLETKLRLETLLSQCKPEENQVIRAYLQGFNNGEIASLMGCSEGRIRNLLTRIKKKLAILGES